MSDVVELRVEDGVGIVIVSEENCMALWAAVEPQVEAGVRAWVLDFATVNYLNSMSIAAVIGLRTKLVREDARVQLANLQDPVKSIFRVLKLERVFDLERDLPAAKADVSGT